MTELGGGGKTLEYYVAVTEWSSMLYAVDLARGSEHAGMCAGACCRRTESRVLGVQENSRNPNAPGLPTFRADFSTFSYVLGFSALLIFTVSLIVIPLSSQPPDKDFQFQTPPYFISTSDLVCH